MSTRSRETFQPEERFALHSQIRRAAVSVTANIVEGSARRGLRDYLHFIGIATASASEVRYLLDLARRLEFLNSREAENLGARFGDLVRGLQKLIVTLEQRA